MDILHSTELETGKNEVGNHWMHCGIFSSTELEVSIFEEKIPFADAVISVQEPKKLFWLWEKNSKEDLWFHLNLYHYWGDVCFSSFTSPYHHHNRQLDPICLLLSDVLARFSAFSAQFWVAQFFFRPILGRSARLWCRRHIPALSFLLVRSYSQLKTCCPSRRGAHCLF